MARKLDVWFFSNRVGTLDLAGGNLRFYYAPDWLEQPGAVALPNSLPLQTQPFDDRTARPFFAGLLPAIADKLRRDPQQGFSSNVLIDQIYDLIEQRCALTIKRLTSSALSSP